MLRFLVGSIAAGGLYAYCKSQHNQVQVWGNGVYNPRKGHPDDILNFSNFTPKLIKNFCEEQSPNLVKMVFGPKADAGIDEKGEIYIWNKHTVNNVKLDDVDDETRDIKKLDFSEKAQDLKFVDGILFALDTKGEVWQWRFDISNKPKARKISRLSNIKKIVSGIGHLVALDKNGTIWTLGDDTYGQCGIDTFSRQLTPPYLQIKYPNPMEVVMLPDKVVDIASGKYHTLALLANGEVWGWGRNNKSQLADIDQKQGKASASISFIPTKINGLLGKKVVKVAAGDMFSFFVVDENGDTEVFGCGLNSRGQLGLGYLTHVTDIIKVQNISNFVFKDQKSGKVRPVGIKDIQCGAEHCLALMDVGAVYSWGANEYGEQANKKRTIQDRPSLLKRFKSRQIVSIAAGDRMSGVIWKE